MSLQMNEYEHWAKSFENQNKTTTWKYGYFHKLISDNLLHLTDLVLVEVGVARGGHCRHLLDVFGDCISKLYGVDPYRSGYDRKDLLSRKSQDEFDFLYMWVNSQCRDPRFEMFRSTSRCVAPTFPDESVDAIYIDGDHTYKGAYTDITAWLPKIKPGGLVSGDDFKQFKGVSKAAAELIPEFKLYENDTWYWVKK